MSELLDKLIKSPNIGPPKIIVYGQPGVGKTSLAASAKAVLLDCEDGASAIPDLVRTPYLERWPDIEQWLLELAGNAPPPPVVAIDTLDWMVQRVGEYVVHDLGDDASGDLTNTIGSSHGGYFKAREIIQNVVYRKLLPLLNKLSSKGSAILLLAHAANTKITTPEGFDQRLATPDLPSWIMPPFIEWADCVLYAHKRDGTGERVLLTESTNLVLAKNRYSMPSVIRLSWPAVMQAMTDKTKNKDK